MLVGILALAVASLFAGAAIYITCAEQPARLGLASEHMLRQWKPSYKRGFAMQASLAIIGFGLGMEAWRETDDWRWMAGALILVSNWPYTLAAIMPVNKRLLAMTDESPAQEVHRLIAKWGRLHAGRGALGACSVVLFVWAAAG